ncbi:hypothetical protein LAZ67_5002947, partial [Cordylochernes scorpioides]
MVTTEDSGTSEVFGANSRQQSYACHIPRNPPIFSGESAQDPQKWIKMFERVAKYNKWDDTQSLANVVFYLEETAAKWFDNNEDIINSWTQFKTDLCEVFGQKEELTRRAVMTLKTRAQKPGETTEFYIQEILSLCSRVNPEMEEEEKVGHLMKGIAEDFYQALIVKDPTTVDELMKFCRQLENMKQRRIKRIRYERVPNVTPISSDFEEDLTLKIRRIVQEELFRREDDYTPYAPRTSDQWRTVDNQPICFHCGKPGHVLRYCRERRRTFEEARLRRTLPAADNATPQRPYDLNDDFPTLPRPGGFSRSASPYPGRGRMSRRRSQSPGADSGADYSVVSEKFRRRLRTPFFVESGPVVEVANGKLIKTLGKCSLKSSCKISVVSIPLQENRDVLICPNWKLLIRKEFIMPSLLTTFWQGKADLWIANGTSKPLMIPSGMALATMSDVDVGSICSLKCDELIQEEEIGITKLDQKIEAMIDSNLTEDQQNKLMNILKKFSDVFDFSGKSQPARSKIKHKIDTGDHAPTKQRPYRVSGMEREIIQQEFDRMMKQDIIQFSESPWSSPVVLVKKNNGSWRFWLTNDDSIRSPRNIRFVENFSHKAKPLNDLLKNDAKFCWNKEKENAFEILKEALTSEPVLGHFIEDAETHIHTDASGYGIGAVLIQTQGGAERPIAYAPRTLTKAEKNYSTTEKELLAVVWARSKFRPYLFGRNFTVVTDHHSLCWLAGLKDPSGRLSRWALRLQEFDITVVYKSGRKHKDADCLSRNPVPEEQEDFPNIISIIDIRVEQSRDANLAKIIDKIEQTGPFKGFEVMDGVLYKRNYEPYGRQRLIVLPKQMRLENLKNIHDAPTAGDPDAGAMEIAKFIVEEIILRHRAPQQIITDRGTNFMSQIIKEINNLSGISHLKTTAYHPQINGLTERLNKTLTDMLSMYVDVEQKNWDEVLPFVTFAYNTAKQETTGFSPFFLVYGREAETTLDSLLPYHDNDNVGDYVQHLITTAEEARHLAQLHLYRGQEKDRVYYDRKHRPVDYNVGDLVWLFIPVRKVGLSEKLIKKYFGPYRITKKLSPVNYEIEAISDSPKHRKIRDTVHVLRMKPYLDPILQEEISDSTPNEEPVLKQRFSDPEPISGPRKSWRLGKEPPYNDVKIDANDSTQTRVDLIMEFLQKEAAAEQDRALAGSKFGLKSLKQDRKVGRQSHPAKIPTASGHFAGRAQNCIFCNKNHKNTECLAARRMSIKERIERIKNAKCCFSCLQPGHISSNCRRRITECIRCKKKHLDILCPLNAPGRESADEDKEQVEDCDVSPTVENGVSFSGLSASSLILLQTLKIKVEGATSAKVVRALLDTGSQRSYILSKTAQNLGLSPIGQESLKHVVFGGHTSENVHQEYRVNLGHASGNFKMVAKLLDQQKICDKAKIADNREVAMKRLEQTTKKLIYLNLYEDYDDIFRGWLDDGIIEKVSAEQHDAETFYLPHRPVVKLSSGTTPIRPVLDASSKVYRSPSLNDCLEKGPNLIEMIPNLMLRRVVFGVNCSPFILGAVIEYHLSNVRPEHKPLSQRLQKSFYVDNLVTSVNYFEELQDLKLAATSIMENARLELSRWEHSLDVASDTYPYERAEISKVLGICLIKGALFFFSTRMLAGLALDMNPAKKKKKAYKPTTRIVNVADLEREDEMVISRNCSILSSIGHPALKSLHEDLIRYIASRTEMIKALATNVENITDTLESFAELDEIEEANKPKTACRDTQTCPAPSCNETSSQTDPIKPATPAPAALPAKKPASTLPAPAPTKRKQSEAPNPPAKRTNLNGPSKPVPSHVSKPAAAQVILHGEKSAAHTVVISDDPQADPREMLKTVRAAHTLPQGVWASLRTKGKLVLHSSNPDTIPEVTTSLASKLDGMKVRQQKEILPRICLFKVDEETSNSTIEETFLETAAVRKLPGDKVVRVAHRSAPRNGTCTAFIEVDLKTFRALGVRGRIVVDGVILNFEESIRARVCFRCCGFGHNSAHCTRAPKCFHCGEDGHEGRTCPSIADQRTSKCANCCSQGLPDKHEARASSCPILNLNPKSMKFLENNGFDVNKALDHGIRSMRMDEYYKKKRMLDLSYAYKFERMAQAYEILHRYESDPYDRHDPEGLRKTLNSWKYGWLKHALVRCKTQHRRESRLKSLPSRNLVATIGRDASSDPVVLNPNIDIPKYDGTEDPRPWIESLEEIGFLYHWADYIISRYAAMNMIGSAKTWLNLHKVSFTSWENFKSRLIEDFASDANKEEMRMRLNRIQQWNEPAIRKYYFNIKFDDKTITHQFVIMRTHLRIFILGRDFLKKMNAKIDCQREIIKYDLTENRDVIKYQQKKIKSAKDAIIPELSIKLINAFVEAEDGEYIIEENHKMFQTNGLRLARSLINVVNKETYIWITNPYPRPLKILKNQTLCFGSQPAEVNLMEESEQKEHEEPQFQINENLAYTEKEQLKQVLERYEDLFSSGLGRSNLAKHRIDTEGAKPIKHKPYRVSAKEREIIKEQIDEMLRDGIIRPSSSPWSFPVILVKKRDGKYRFCVDYRKLNDVTVKDVYPIPRIDEVLDTLQGSKYFSAIDLKSGYWQVEVEEKDKEKTAFTTAHGLYEFNVMPFGLCNAPATFERNMENMLGNLRWQICLCYLDDVIIYSSDFSTHLKRIEAVLKCFREANLKLNNKKCQFAFEELEILGHITNQHGIKPAEHNIKAIRDFPRPKKIKEVQSFLGMCSYYRKFIKGFSKIADPLTSLIKKNVPFTWTENQEKAFQTLKVALINPPILGHFDPNAITYIHTDASNIGLGATLVQKFGDKEKVISYLSRTLSKPEQNYSTTEKECLAVVWSMSKLRPYLYGRHFKIVTDHHALCWLKNLKDPTGRLARWALKIQEYNFEIIHKSGKKHLDADGLSRGPLPENEWDEDYERLFLNQIIDEKDDFIENIKENLSGNKRSITQNFKEENGCLYKKNPNPEGRAWLLVVPKKRRKEVMSEYHNHMLNGHLGVARTTYRLKNKYYWPSMLKDVSEFVKTCHLCQSRKGSNHLPSGLLQPIPPANYPFERIGIDFVGPLPSTKRRRKWIIVLTDYYTKPEEEWPKEAKGKDLGTILATRMLKLGDDSRVSQSSDVECGRESGKLIRKISQRLGIGWDEELTPDIYAAWKLWLGKFKEIHLVQVPRCYHPDLLIRSIIRQVEVQAFVDASQEALSIVTYLPEEEWPKEAKGKDLGTILATRMLKLGDDSRVSQSSDVECRRESGKLIRKISQRLLPEKFETFAVIERCVMVVWKAAKLWRDKTQRKRSRLHRPLTRLLNLEDFSSLNRLVCLAAAVQKAARFWHKKTFHKSGELNPPWKAAMENNKVRQHSFTVSPEECRSAVTTLVRWVQTESFPREIAELTKSRIVKKAKIALLSPYLINGTICLKSHILQANKVPAEQKTPAILPYDHHVMELLIQAKHERCAYQGSETLLNNLCGRFWIIDERQTVLRTIRKCPRCRLSRASPVIPEMGQLPHYRLAAYQCPFTFTGPLGHL